MRGIKECVKCYWFYKFDSRHCAYKDEESDICENYSECCLECNNEQGEYKFNDSLYCIDCLLEEVGITKKPCTTYMYELNGEFVGMSDDLDDEDVLRQIGVKYEKVE